MKKIIIIKAEQWNIYIISAILEEICLIGNLLFEVILTLEKNL